MELYVWVAVMTHPKSNPGQGDDELRQNLLHYFGEPAEYMLKDGSSRLAAPNTDDVMHLFAAHHARLLLELRSEAIPISHTEDAVPVAAIDAEISRLQPPAAPGQGESR